MFSSDDFAGSELGSEWSILTPTGTTQGLGGTGTDGVLTLSTEGGSHDLWRGAKDVPRAMQAVADEDFTLETRFLSVPSKSFQMQGFLIEAAGGAWLRFDTFSDGSKLYAFGAVTVNGSTSVAFQQEIPAGVAPYLRLERAGDSFTFSYSQDGVDWTGAGSLTRAVTVTEAGVFAGSLGAESAFTAQIDYIESAGDPLSDEDGGYVPPPAPPVAEDDALVTAADTPLTIEASELLANDSDANGDALSIVAVGTPEHGTLTETAGGWVYTPASGYNGADSFTYELSDGSATDTGTVTLTVGTPPPPDSGFSSDDFAGSELGSEWSILTPTGTTQGLGGTGTDGVLTLSTEGGSHDLWRGAKDVPRAMQAVADEDFTLETRFLSVPSKSFQMQGFLVEAAGGAWLRFDTFSDGSKLYAFGAVTVNGSTSVAFQQEIPAGVAPYLRLERAGDSFTFSYSQDGVDWTGAGSLTRAVTVTEAGVFAGSLGAESAFTAQIDYIESAGDPLSDEDGGYVPPPAPPVAEDDALVTAADTPLTIEASELLANDSDANGDALSIVAVGTPEHGTLTETAGGWVYTPASGYNGADSFTYELSDGSATDTGTVTLTVGTPPPPDSGFSSDDFAGSELGSEWSILTPTGTTQGLGGTGTDGVLTLSTEGGSHDLWRGAKDVPRAMQAVADEDFTLETRFLSVPSKSFQMQGFLVEAAGGAWLRFDTFSDGSKLYAFGAVTVNGSTSVAFQQEIPAGVAPYLRLERAGDSFTFSYSQDGVDWTGAGSLTRAVTVTEAGVFAGSLGAESAFTAQIDYIESAGDPLSDEDGGYVPPPAPPVAEDDALVTAADTPLTIEASELLANDSDANGDALSIVSVGTPEHGTLTETAGGWVYTPASGYNGADSFSYELSDGSATDTGTVSLTVGTPPPPDGSVVSDDFAGGGLDPAWEFHGIAGGVEIGYRDEDAFAMIRSPRGVQVSASDVMTTPRILQDALDIDFQISAGFLTEPWQQYQEHGLLVVQDDANWLRFDLAYTGSTLSLIVGTITNGNTAYPLFQSMDPGEVDEFQITRQGNTWTFEYRAEGEADWTEAYSFVRDLGVTQVGAFAGSTSFDGEVPGYTAYLDYFENTALPITDEDGDYESRNHAPVAGDDSFNAAGGVTFTLADLLENDRDPDVDDSVSITSIGAPSHGVLTGQGDGIYTYVPDAGFVGTDSFTYSLSDGSLSDSATVTLDVADPVSVWYGDVQSFGQPGEGQTWVNILGNVDPSVTTLAYSLNGGPEVQLSIGSDTRRLQNPGDFNVDIAYSALDGSAADDTVTLIATLDTGATVTHDVTIDYLSGSDWARDYSIDWSEVSDIQDVVQVVDGTWEIGADGVRPVDLGYDRLLVLGDSGWDNYRLETTITMHDLQNRDPNGRDGGAFAIGMLWGGHTDQPIEDMQPKSGWEPGAAFFYTYRLESHSYHEFAEYLGTKQMGLNGGATYNVTVEVTQSGIYDRGYAMKIWQEGTAEPTEWTLQTTETFSLDEAPATGGLYLNAHYFDVSFGDVTVSEITGSDIIAGDESAETLIAVDPTDPAAGRGEIDVFTGAGGADVFIFGDASGVFYDDGQATTSGTEDYGFVWDFDESEDRVQLHGDAAEYSLTEDAAGLTPGTAIWSLASAQPELVGVLNGVYGLSLDSDVFVFTDDLVA